MELAQRCFRERCRSFCCVFSSVYSLTVLRRTIRSLVRKAARTSIHRLGVEQGGGSGGDTFGRGAGCFFRHATGFHGAAHKIFVSWLGVRSFDAGGTHRDVRRAQGTASADRARSLTSLSNIIVVVRQSASEYATFLVRGLKGCEYSGLALC